MKLKRRDWVRLALSQSMLVGATGAAAEPRVESDPFALGVASGHPGSQSIVLWTRLVAPNPLSYPWQNLALSVHWELAEEPGFAAPVKSGEVQAHPALSHSVHVEVEGLQPNRRYWYRFRCGAFTSPVGRTRTLPAEDDHHTPLKVAFACCQRYHSGPFVAYDAMADDDPDLVVFLGDYIYEMGASQNEARGSWAYPASTDSDYRGLYELAKSDTALQRMHAACPWVVIWDDHEVLNDYAGGDVRLRGAKGKTAQHMEIGYRAWYEHMPVSPRVLLGGAAGRQGGPQELRIYGSLRWGQLAHLHGLDTRQYRSAPVSCGTAGWFRPGSCEEIGAAGRSMLGDAQADWLDGQLRANGEGQSGATRWNLICQPTVFSRFAIPVMGGVVSRDMWDGFPASRTRIIETLVQARTRNPVFVGGDVHQNWVAQVRRDPDRPDSEIVAAEFCATSLTTRSAGRFSAEEQMAIAPHCVYTDRQHRGYLLAELNAERLLMKLRRVDLRSGQASVAAVFELRAGSPVVKPVSA